MTMEAVGTGTRYVFTALHRDEADLEKTGGFPNQLEGTLRAVVDEIKRRRARTDPRFALLVGEHVHRSMKRSLLRPGGLALFEHALAHDVGTDALKGAADQIVDRTGLSARTELEGLAEVPLIDEPRHQRTPLGAPALVLRRVPVLDGHSFRRHVAVETERDVYEYLAHGSSLTILDVGLIPRFPRKGVDRRSMTWIGLSRLSC